MYGSVLPRRTRSSNDRIAGGGLLPDRRPDNSLWPSYEENRTYFGNSNQGPIYDIGHTFVEIFLDTGQIKTRPDITKAVDDSFLRTLNE